MQKLQSIEAIHKVFNTSGSYPVLVTCDDFQDWVCKYGVSSHLINEYLGASFAEIWGINTPPTSFVKIKPEHIPNEFALPKSKFAKYCFGSLYLKEAELINDSLTSLFRGSKLKNHLKNKEDILKIALFDMWLANEDRTPNNTNLLLYSKKADKSFDFYAIDHVAIFNSGNLRHGLFLLNEFDTILNADFVKILFRNEHNIEKSVGCKTIIQFINNSSIFGAHQ